jgi:hypothetical protein
MEKNGRLDHFVTSAKNIRQDELAENEFKQNHIIN